MMILVYISPMSQYKNSARCCVNEHGLATLFSISTRLCGHLMVPFKSDVRNFYYFTASCLLCVQVFKVKLLGAIERTVKEKSTPPQAVQTEIKQKLKFHQLCRPSQTTSSPLLILIYVTAVEKEGVCKNCQLFGKFQLLFRMYKLQFASLMV